jgi:hypothetical protein
VVDLRITIGLDDQPNSLSGGFAEVEFEGDETVAGAVSDPVAPGLGITSKIPHNHAEFLILTHGGFHDWSNPRSNSEVTGIKPCTLQGYGPCLVTVSHFIF